MLDVAGRTIRQMWQPDGGSYAQTCDFAFGVAIAAATLPGLLVETAALR